MGPGELTEPHQQEGDFNPEEGNFGYEVEPGTGDNDGDGVVDPTNEQTGAMDTSLESGDGTGRTIEEVVAEAEEDGGANGENTSGDESRGYVAPEVTEDTGAEEAARIAAEEEAARQAAEQAERDRQAREEQERIDAERAAEQEAARQREAEERAAQEEAARQAAAEAAAQQASEAEQQAAAEAAAQEEAARQQAAQEEQDAADWAAGEFDLPGGGN